MSDIIIIGASGHGKVIADLVVRTGNNLVGFIDDNSALPQKILGFDFLGNSQKVLDYKDKCKFIIGIGSNAIRKKISQKYDVEFATLIHPSAQIGLDVHIDAGSVVMANAVINSCTKIGKHCIINTAAIIEHDNCIQDFVHISPNATVCGTVNIGENCHIGASTTIKNNINICNDVVLGIGACVVKNIEKPAIYIGVPARELFNEKKHMDI